MDPSLVHADRRISLLAARQDGIVAWAQLIALGISRGIIARRVQRGTLRALHVGVYLWAAPAPTFRARVRAAVLACGRGAFASHDASAALWGHGEPQRGPIDITVVGRRVRGHGIRGHEALRLHPDDRDVCAGIAVTAPARSLLEIAGRLSQVQLADAVEQAQLNRRVRRDQILAAIERAPRLAGAGVLRALAEEPAFTRSRAERRLVALVRAARLPEPEFNVHVDGCGEVDVLWRRQRVVLEFDSYAFHATRSAFERDRRRDAGLTRDRYVVLRTTWSELTERSHALVARLAEALAFSVADRRADPAARG
ncbi:MAG: type IV toxin-antitoxin system AbiEi family antitoxin domain-containing protein [Solirubrobacteraceae bacterium]|nr:type IV toxin-antitoxin system AbiEi family antitoxin domain-containing protein [Solirubrobacteraceae bacterium]